MLSIAILGFVAAFIVLTAKPGRSHPAAPSSPSGEEATEPARDREDSLRWELASLRSEVARLQGQVAAAGPRSAPAPTPPPAPQTPEQAAAEANRFYGKFEARVIRESKDALWSDKTEAAINRLISEAKTPGTQVKSVTCRTSLCEVTTVSQDLNAQSKLSNLIGTQEPFVSSGGIYYRYGAGATPMTTVYMLRPGADPEVP